MTELLATFVRAELSSMAGIAAVIVARPALPSSLDLTSATGEYGRALELAVNEDLRAAIPLLVASAAAGDPRSSYALACLRRDGLVRGRQADIRRGLRVAARKGVPEAALAVALNVELGRYGERRNGPGAGWFFLKSALLGRVEGLYHLGRRWVHGIGGRKCAAGMTLIEFASANGYDSERQLDGEVPLLAYAPGIVSSGSRLWLTPRRREMMRKKFLRGNFLAGRALGVDAELSADPNAAAWYLCAAAAGDSISGLLLWRLSRRAVTDRRLAVSREVLRAVRFALSAYGGGDLIDVVAALFSGGGRAAE